MLQKSRFFMVMLVALLALGLVLMGCSDGSDPDPTPSPGSETPLISGDGLAEGGSLVDSDKVAIENGKIKIDYDTSDPDYEWVYQAVIAYDTPLDISNATALVMKWEGLSTDLQGTSITLTIIDAKGQKIVGDGLWTQGDSLGTLTFTFADAKAGDDGKVTFADSDKTCAAIEIFCDFMLVTSGWLFPGVTNPDGGGVGTGNLDALQPWYITDLIFIGEADDDGEEEVSNSYVLTAADASWITALGSGDITVTPGDGNIVLVFENEIDVSGYDKLVIKVTTTATPGWYGGQLGTLKDGGKQYGYWGGDAINFNNGVLTFDLNEYDIDTTIGEVVYSIVEAPLDIYLE